MRYTKINSNQAVKNWAKGITESTGIKDPNKLQWISEMLEIQNALIREEKGLMNESYGVQGPEASGRMGDVLFPEVGKAPNSIMAQGYQRGSGDMTSHQLAFAMNVASYTIGLDLLPVIPVEYPSLMHGYLDHIYSANFDQTQAEQGETDIYIQFKGEKAGFSTGRYSTLKKGDKVFLGLIPTDLSAELKTVQNAVYGTFLGIDRINANPIIRFEGVVTATATGTTGAVRSYTLGVATDATPNSGLKIEAGAGYEWALIKGTAGSTSVAVINDADALVALDSFISADNGTVSGDLVSAVDMFIPEFSKPNADYSGDESYTATRKAGELGTQNIVSLRTFSTSVEMQTIEVLGEVTRTQKRDMASYGQDALGQLYKAAQNELTQVMNADILRTQFRLGVTAHTKLKNAQGMDLNLYIGDPSTSPNEALTNFGLTEFKDINGVDRTNEFPSVKNAESNSSAENSATRARRIITRIQASANMISTVGRYGGGDFVVLNAQLATALQDIKGYIVNPFDNTLTINDSTLHNIGSINGRLQVYVDPNMAWNDTRVLVGRKGTETDPGLKLFIYTMGDVVQTLSEKAMSEKLLVSNRYALVPCGFHPEVNYITFAVRNDYGII